MATNQTVRDVMTHTVASCSPEMTLMDAAKLMNDLNIGDVVVMDDGKVRGIITDRDIVVRAVAKGIDPRTERIKDHMTTGIVAGRTDWDLDKAADTLAKHQIRRLPIVENDRLVGIVSLGDVARYERDKKAVASSLKDISTPEGLHHNGNGMKQIATGMALATVTGAAVSFLFVSKTGRRLREQFMKEMDKVDWSENATQVLTEVRDKLEFISENIPDLQPKRKAHKILRMFG